MTAARKALDALEAARRKVSLPWKVDGLPLIDSDDSWAFRGHWHTPGPDASEKDKCDAVEDAEAEGVYVVAAVNLSAPLAAVVRAAMEYREAMRMTDEADGAEIDGADVDAVGAMDREDAAKDQLDAALDAFDAAALAQGFQP